ncbi:MAG: hypothetical protein SNJ57_11810 [Cyanobacteriota bacterium]
MARVLISDAAKTHQAFGRWAIALRVSHNSLQFRQAPATDRRGEKS